MRFGMMLAAAAALVVGACQASAATFVEYQALGTGTRTTCCTTYPPPTYTGDLVFDFVVEVDPGYTMSIGVGTGSYYFNGYAGDEFTASISSGKVNVSYLPDQHSYGPTGSATINLDSPSANTFADIPSYSDASGSAYFSVATPFGGYNVSGVVNSLVRIGVVDGYRDPFASIVPEPATWAMMIVGFGAIGAFARRRSRARIAATA